jgi:hypothetical protein
VDNSGEQIYEVMELMNCYINSHTAETFGTVLHDADHGDYWSCPFVKKE